MSAETHFGVVPADTLKSMSGLEFLTAMLEGRLPAPPICEVMDFRAQEVAAGRVVFIGHPGHRHFNPIGSVHGGYAATLLDSAMGCAVQSTLPRGTGYTTLEFKVHFIRALGTDSAPVRAEGSVIQSGRRVAVAEARLTDARGRLCATATTTCLVFAL